MLDILDVDVDWKMHQISDGERRRVQLTMGLMEPWEVLLLDEVTVDLEPGQPELTAVSEHKDDKPIEAHERGSRRLL